MKIAILSRNRHLYSTRRLVEEGINRGHEVKVIDCLHCSMNITSADPRIHYHEEVLEDFDAHQVDWEKVLDIQGNERVTAYVETLSLPDRW